MSQYVASFLYTASLWLLPIVFAITLHEAAHAWTAAFFGDPTARNLGRLSLNPFRHVDRFGTVLLPCMLLIATQGQMALGYAKPVPVDFSRLRPLRLGMALTAAAGPALNVVLAVLAALSLGFFFSSLSHPVGLFSGWIAENLSVLLSSIWFWRFLICGRFHLWTAGVFWSPFCRGAGTDGCFQWSNTVFLW